MKKKYGTMRIAEAISDKDTLPRLLNAISNGEASSLQEDEVDCLKYYLGIMADAIKDASDEMLRSEWVKESKLGSSVEMRIDISFLPKEAVESNADNTTASAKKEYSSPNIVEKEPAKEKASVVKPAPIEEESRESIESLDQLIAETTEGDNAYEEEEGTMEALSAAFAPVDDDDDFAGLRGLIEDE